MGLTALPALIDPHVHFRVPGGEHKETWETAARAAIAGGVTTVFDMPNTQPATVSLTRLEEKERLIDEQLKAVAIPLHYRLYLGADKNHLGEIPKVKERVAGLKIYMGSSTGDLLVNDESTLDEAFRMAAASDMLVAVHAEDEQLIQLHRERFPNATDASVHSAIRNGEVAKKAVAMAIEKAVKHKARLYIVHVSSKEELALIREAKKQNLPVYAEASPHHLFLDESAYKPMGTRALVNPPLRSGSDREALWEALHDGTIDTIGTDHAPHTLAEKNLPYGRAPSGFPSIELYLALLLNAYSEKKISLEQIISLTHTRIQEIFRIPESGDVVLVDLEKKKTVDDASLQTKAKWSPYAGWTLQGWPRFTILRGQIYDIEKM